MQPFLLDISDFVQDTCVVVVCAYLLTRLRVARILLRQQVSTPQALLLGTALGLIGLTGLFVRQLGFKYASETLCITFAAAVGGWRVSLLSTAILSLGALTLRPSGPPAINLIPVFAASLLIAPMIRRARSSTSRLLFGFMTGAVGQAVRLLSATIFRHLFGQPPLLPSAWITIYTNGLGLFLLLLVISDAQAREDSEEQRLQMEKQRADLEQSRALTVEAQLAALRARIHPHFLFNALNSIAELCHIAPERAETATLSLSQLMRQILETSSAATIPLSQELATTRAYLRIEQERLGERLRIVWWIDSSCETVPIVPLAVQILVENAVNHGIGPRPEGGSVSVIVCRTKRRILVAVKDDGVGMRSEARPRRRPGSGTHGMQILDQQLVLRRGERARLRCFSVAGKGTLMVFALPFDPPH